MLQWQEMAVSHGCLPHERGTYLGGDVPCSIPFHSLYAYRSALMLMDYPTRGSCP
jgi:hypothetical protein